MIDRLTDDDRYEVAALADAGERSNRPTHLVAFGVIALMIACVAVLWAWRADSAAAEQLARRARDIRQINERSAVLSELLASQVDAPREDENTPIPDMLSRLQNLAREAGLTNLPEVPRTENESYQNARRVNYRYSSRDRSQVRDQSLESMMAWVSLATERIPGLYVRQISLRPQANAWAMDVTFARYERIEP